MKASQNCDKNVEFCNYPYITSSLKLPKHPNGVDPTYFLLEVINLHNGSQKSTENSEIALKISIFFSQFNAGFLR
jgi:hypothetical protein